MNLAIDVYSIQQNKTKEEAKQNSLIVSSVMELSALSIEWNAVLRKNWSVK